MSETEQNKTEDATAFKLKKAREKGNVARGSDLGFFAVMTALSIFTVTAGTDVASRLSEMMRLVFLSGMQDAVHVQYPIDIIAKVYGPIFQMLALLGGTIVLSIVALEILQLRGIVFSTHPLKPDFSRINPAKGLKRIFSIRMLKDALKNIFKMTVYGAAAVVVTYYSIQQFDLTMTDAGQVVTAIFGSAMRLIFVFTALALIFAAIDQIIARQGFRKQMRMSKSELKRETKDREGEPRQKQKRKQLHAEFTKQTQNLGDLPGSDILIVNPQHFAVALRYIQGEMKAPRVTAKGRNRFALHLKHEARRLGIPVIENKPLARGLFSHQEIGTEVRSKYYHPIAQIYLHLRQAAAEGSEPATHA